VTQVLAFVVRGDDDDVHRLEVYRRRVGSAARRRLPSGSRCRVARRFPRRP
jgi:hypothetical protein